MRAPQLKPHQFKPGQSGNPGGKPKLPDELKAIRCLGPEEVSRLVAKYARLSQEDLEAAGKDPKTPSIEVSIAAIFMKTMRTGSSEGLSFLLDRSIGRAPEMIDNDENRQAREELKKLTDEEFLKLAKQKLAELEAPK